MSPDMTGLIKKCAWLISTYIENIDLTVFVQESKCCKEHDRVYYKVEDVCRPSYHTGQGDNTGRGSICDEDCTENAKKEDYPSYDGLRTHTCT